MLYSAEAGLVWLLTGAVSSLAGVFRAVALHADNLRPASPSSGAALPPRALALGSCMSALYRAHALASLAALRPALCAALIGNGTRGRPPLDEADEGEELWPAVRGGGSGVVLNAGQAAALEELGGPVEIVQGPPGTGKSSFITEVFLQRIPRVSTALRPVP